MTEGTAAKGDVLGVARLAGIMAAKKTAELIPLCHPLAARAGSASSCAPAAGRVEIEATVATTGPTGVEMEALTAVSVAALTVYDMLKAVDRGMVIGEVRLALKEGGKQRALRGALMALIPVAEAHARLIALVRSGRHRGGAARRGRRPRARRATSSPFATSRRSTPRRWTATPAAPPTPGPARC